MDSKITYFEDIKPENTECCLELVRARSAALGIRKLVLASTTGATAMKAANFFKDTGSKLIVIPHQYGFREQNSFPTELIQTLRAAGHEVHFGTMLFHTDTLYGTGVAASMANLLRCFCQGMKVCLEIVMMAADAGLLTMGEKVIAIAGTSRGADTALVTQAASSQHLKQLRVNEIICKPLNFQNNG